MGKARHEFKTRIERPQELLRGEEISFDTAMKKRIGPPPFGNVS